MMNYFIGIDGGGTKTRGILGDHEGRILADLTIGPSNHQLVGKDNTRLALQTLHRRLLAALPTPAEDRVHHAYLALSGADLPSDFQLLDEIVVDIFHDIPFTIGNDAWAVLRSGLHQPWGAASIYGTGANACAVGLDGHRSILRALHYDVGGGGGGDEMAYAAFHYAFRADEGTYTPTRLTEALPKLFELKTMEDLLALLYPHAKLNHYDFKKIPPLIFDLARAGDAVCIEILRRMGRTQGEMVRGMILRSRLEEEAVPVVLGGSVYKGNAPHFIEATMNAIQEIAPKAYALYPELPPVAGAYLLAAEASGALVTPQVYETLIKHLPLSP